MCVLVCSLVAFICVVVDGRHVHPPPVDAAKTKTFVTELYLLGSFEFFLLLGRIFQFVCLDFCLVVWPWLWRRLSYDTLIRCGRKIATILLGRFSVLGTVVYMISPP